MPDLERRTLLAGLAATAAATAAGVGLAAQPPAIPIIDTHIHLFDPDRPQGAPYTGPKSSSPPIAATPARYRALAGPLGVVGAVKVEASPWVEDNLWVLEVAERDPIIVGVVGNLEPEKPEFPDTSIGIARTGCSAASAAATCGGGTSRRKSNRPRSSPACGASPTPIW